MLRRERGRSAWLSGWWTALPDHATTERSKAKRGTRVYVDVMQNAKGHHAVPPVCAPGGAGGAGLDAVALEGTGAES